MCTARRTLYGVLSLLVTDSLWGRARLATSSAHRLNQTVGSPPPDVSLALPKTLRVNQSTPALTNEQRRGSRQALGAKPSTAGGKARNGDSSKGRALQRTWTRPEPLAADYGGSGGEAVRSSTSPHEAGLGIDQQAAALGLYA